MAVKVWHLGYRGLSVDQVVHAVERAGAILMDIRFSAGKPGDPWWARGVRDRLGDRFVENRALGNRAYKSGGLELADARGGIGALLAWMEHRPVVLMCACERLDGCHRRSVLDILKQRGAVTEEEIGDFRTQLAPGGGLFGAA